MMQLPVLGTRAVQIQGRPLLQRAGPAPPPLRRCAPRCRPFTAKVAAAEGFGAKKQKQKQPRSKDGTVGVDGSGPQDKAVKKALRAAGAARPIDPSEAARGRLDVATVKDWGSGAPGELGDLAVTGVRARFDAAAERPLSVQLALLLEQLESQGALRLADGGRALPPFERWSFSRPRYAQYLADLGAAHAAMEDAVDAALASSGQGGDGKGEEEGRGPDKAGPSAPVREALARLGRGCGLRRAAQLQRDLDALVRGGGGITGGGGGGGGGGSGGGGGGGSGGSGGSGSGEGNSGSNGAGGARGNGGGSPAAPAPGGSAAAFAAYMAGLGAAASSPASTDDERDRAALRLLACAYSLLASFLSLGTRVGAAAAERAGAAAAGALRAYTDYPGGLQGGGPAAALVAAVDAAGAGLSAAQRQAVYDELPRAFPKAALTIAALAQED